MTSDKKPSGKLAGLLRRFDALCESAVKAEGVKQAAVVRQLRADVKELEGKAKGVSRSKAGKLRNWQGATLEQSREMLAFAEGREERTREVCDGLAKSLRALIKDKEVKTSKMLRDVAVGWVADGYLECHKVKGRRARQFVSQAVKLVADSK